MPKNYYLILGVSADSSVDEIKMAYRRLAKEFHPDYFGSNSSFFMAIQEAYSILSDPVRRQKYDSVVNKSGIEITYKGERKSASANYAADAEPLIPGTSSSVRPISPLKPFRPLQHSAQNQWLSGISEISNYHGASSKQLEIHVNISWWQAQAGGHVRIAIPVSVLCPECSGKEAAGYYPCWRCYDSGTLQGDLPILLSYPPAIENKHTVRINLGRYGSSDHILVKFNIR